MRYFLLFFVFVLSGCYLAAPPDQMMDNEDDFRIVSFPCDDMESNSTDWVYCDPVEFDYSNLNIESVVMRYSLRVTREKEDKVVAELYDYHSKTSIPLSQVESVVGYVQHTRVSADLSDFLVEGPQKVGIRFRVTRDDAVGFISTGSRLVFLLKN